MSKTHFESGLKELTVRWGQGGDTDKHVPQKVLAARKKMLRLPGAREMGHHDAEIRAPRKRAPGREASPGGRAAFPWSFTSLGCFCAFLKILSDNDEHTPSRS